MEDIYKKIRNKQPKEEDRNELTMENMKRKNKIISEQSDVLWRIYEKMEKYRDNKITVVDVIMSIRREIDAIYVQIG